MIAKALRLPLVLTLLGGLGLWAGANDEAGVVIAPRLNVRARPGLQYEVLCQLRRGQRVKIVKHADEWLGIAPPPTAAAWVAAADIVDNKVVVAQTEVRAGPHAVFSTIAKLGQGDAVEVRPGGSDKWLRIAPPAKAVLWVHRDYVEPAGAGAPAAGAKPAPKRQSGPRREGPQAKGSTSTGRPISASEVLLRGESGAATTSPGSKPTAVETPARGKTPRTGARPATGPQNGLAPKIASGASASADAPGRGQLPVGGVREVTIGQKRYRIQPVAGQPRSVAIRYVGAAAPLDRQGVVILMAGEKDPRTFGLAAMVDDLLYPVAYLDKSRKDLRQFLGQTVRVSGRQRWVEGWPRPLIEVQAISAATP